MHASSDRQSSIAVTLGKEGSGQAQACSDVGLKLCWMVAKLCIAAAVVAVTTAAGVANGGVSISRREEDSHGNYKFDYDVNDAHGNTQNRWETTDAHNVRKGGYSFTEPDGRFRQVQYEADGHGFRVLVRTNEPGTITHFPDHAAVIHEVPPVQGKQVSAAGLAPAPGHGVGLVQPPPLALKPFPGFFSHSNRLLLSFSLFFIRDSSQARLFMHQSQSTACQWCIRFQLLNRMHLSQLLFSKYNSLTREAASMGH
ncbi:putative cuticle protein [Ixodes scapularis]